MLGELRHRQARRGDVLQNVFPNALDMLPASHGPQDPMLALQLRHQGLHGAPEVRLGLKGKGPVLDAVGLDIGGIHQPRDPR